MIDKHKFGFNKISIKISQFDVIIKRLNWIFFVGLLGGSLVWAVGVHAKAIGPQSYAPTAISEGTLFVKPNGSGEICSRTNPCDIETAVDKASGGDVVFLRGGTYTLSKNLVLGMKGSATNPIVFESYPGETAVFDGSQHPKGTQIMIHVNGKFIHIRGIKVKNMPRQGIWIYGSDNLVEGVRVQGSGLNGIQVYSPYGDYPYGTYGSRNIIRNNIVHDNSDAGVSTNGLRNGWNADGIAISSGRDNRVENNLVYGNSDDGIDAWRSVKTYIGYNIVHSNGIANGDGNGIKAGGNETDSGTIIEHNLSYSNRAFGVTYNTGVNLKFFNNTTWNNKYGGYRFDSDTTVKHNIAGDATKKRGSGIEVNNSWQRSGNVTFISTDPSSSNFLVPKSGGGFEDIGAHVNATNTNTNTTNNTATSLPDVVVTELSYANGIFTSRVKNQGNAATPSGVVIAVAYFVNGKYRTWGAVNGPLAAGASATVGTDGSPYAIPDGTHTIKAYVDDVDRFEESNENNNQLSQSITLPGSGGGGGGTTTTSLPDLVVTQVSYANGNFTSTIKNQGGAATSDIFISVEYLVDGKYTTWGGQQGPLAAGESITVGSQGGSYKIPSGNHTITAFVDNLSRIKESNENNNRISKSITIP
ncbi:MAG: right-handed parallel beta-helix repeat-containing protein [Nitrosomonas sp.]|nr:right-handed parallel beta-helix repeat-containing protein [Nitrosomonas sp.]